ncbi:MAG: hypothetical protein K2G69_02405 [Muribaculaceae bacterium]|nr:hypothetical protein [Muribaculaceae bacterium]
MEDMTGVAQSNPQLPGYDISELVVTSPMGNTLNIIDLNEAGQTNVPVVTVDNSGNLPEGYSIVADYTLGDEGFAKSVTLPLTFDGTTGYVSTDEIEKAFETIYGMSPDMKVLYGRVEVFAKNAAGSLIRLGGENTYYAERAFECTPDTGLVLEDSYYLIGTMCNWDMTNAVKFKATGTDPWTNPVFTVVVDVPADCWWKIVPGSVQATGNWGSGLCSQWGVQENGDTALEGTLIPTNKDGEEPNAGLIETAGTYRFTINVLEGTYRIEEVIPAAYLYTPGNSNGWSQTASMVLTSTDDKNYQGFAYLDGEFKFSSQADWDGTNYGKGAVDGTLSTGALDPNLSAEAGLYWVKVNVIDLTYELTLISKLGAIGAFNSWGGDTELTPSDDFKTWTASVDFGDGGEWKIRANGDWALSWGGSMVDMIENSQTNLQAPGTGVWTVSFNLGEVPYTVTCTK